MQKNKVVFYHEPRNDAELLEISKKAFIFWKIFHSAKKVSQEDDFMNFL